MKTALCYTLIENDRADGEEISYTLVLVRDLGPSREHVAQKVQAVIDGQIHYVGHTYETAARALASTSFKVRAGSGVLLSPPRAPQKTKRQKQNE